MKGKIVLVTGASGGIGLACAKAFLKEGAVVYGTSRSPKAESMNGIRMLPLDVLSEESAAACIAALLEKEGRLDILVNNAGSGIAGPLTDMTTQELSRQLDVNVLGMHRMVRAAMPALFESRGSIVNISSVAGFVPIPFQSGYSASKYAVESLSESLRAELHPYGVKVALVEPGDTKTGFTASRILTKEVSPRFEAKFCASLARMEKDEQNGAPPEKVAKAVLRAAKSKNPPVRITVGLGYSLLRFVKRLLPDRLVLFIIRLLYA
ncbi:MAG: SDR family oxidoreductase [Clostridia bacterium]|nr:SDR family oxidoreductase [Clostridia bacterium]